MLLFIFTNLFYLISYYCYIGTYTYAIQYVFYFYLSSNKGGMLFIANLSGVSPNSFS